MKVILSVLLLTAWAACPGVCVDGTQLDMLKPITLDQALDVAFQYSPTIRVAVDQIKKAQGGMDQARANYNPKFNAEAIHLWQGPAVAFPVPGGPIINIVQAQDTTLAGSFLLPLDISSQLGFTSDIARYQYQIQYLNLKTVAQQLIFDVKRSYYNLLLARGREEVAQSAVDVAAERLKNTNSKYSVGTVPKFDVTRAQVEVANLNQNLIRSKSTVAIARSAFNRQLGIDVNSPTEVVRSEIDVQNIKVDIPKDVQVAYANRPEVKAAETAIKLNTKNAKLQRSFIMPSLAATGTVTYDVQAQGFTTQNTSFIALLDLKMPIWDGGVAKAKVDQAYADVEISRDSLDQLKLGVGLEVRTAALNLQEAIERVATTAESVALAEETLRLANVRYNAGISVLVEVTDAESALTQSKFDYVNARWDYAVSLADLQRATSTQPEAQKLQLIRTGARPV